LNNSKVDTATLSWNESGMKICSYYRAGRENKKRLLMVRL
jgi:hypothetical protein